jgi:cell division protein FtsL
MATAYQWGGEYRGEFVAQAQPQKSAGGVAHGRKSAATVEFCTVKKIDNSRLVRHVEPLKMRTLYKTAALGAIVAAFCMLYVYQHFHCIDLGFQLEDLRAKTQQAQVLNSELKLEIAYLRDPHRIDVIARRQLGLTQPTANQVREFTGQDGADVAAMQYVRPNHAP